MGYQSNGFCAKSSYFTLKKVKNRTGRASFGAGRSADGTPQRKRPVRFSLRRIEPPSSRFPQAKPEWVKPAILGLHEQLGVSHRKLADAFNHLYFASTGVSVGRMWVMEVLIKHEYEKLHIQKTLKYRVPKFLKKNTIWGIDTTCVRDVEMTLHIVLGIIDHGSRMNVLLQQVKRFNAWTFLGYLFLAIGMYGKPRTIKMDKAKCFGQN